MSILAGLLNLSILAGLAVLLRRQHWAQELAPYYYPALLLKCFCGILLGVLYFQYYGSGDTITYHKASLILTELAKKDPGAYARLLFFNEFSNDAFRASVPFSRLPGFTNSFFFIKLLSLLNLLTNSSYYLNGFYLSLFSFWGAARLTAVLAQTAPTYKKGAILAFLFFPSVVFWSAGLLKDALLFGSMCWVIAFFLQLAHFRKLPLTTLLLALPMAYLFCRIKFFLALLVLPLLVLYLLIKAGGRASALLSNPKRQALLLLILLLIGTGAGMLVFKVYSNGFFYTNLVEGYEHLLALSQQRPHIQYPELAPTISSFLQNAPEAVFGAIYRPFLGESGNWLYVLIGLENLVVLLLTLLAISAAIRRKKAVLTPEQVLFLALVALFAIIFGLSTPNFGTLSRYRIAFLPFLLYLLLQNAFARRLLYQQRARQKTGAF
ncbi:hypothetical protein [Pontibacter liquoris]|uniref:hypothetical protein n=1 Tax=Pontibacter liquoris TaxID=2905677 RepID=UPI001FA6D9A1|nr:hypothetical protein [Pontibacter liquoris]